MAKKALPTMTISGYGYAMDMVNNRFTAWLNSLPKERRSVLADEIGCTRMSLWRYESGIRVPRGDIIERIEEVSGGRVPANSWSGALIARRVGSSSNGDEPHTPRATRGPSVVTRTAGSAAAAVTTGTENGDAA